MVSRMLVTTALFALACFGTALAQAPALPPGQTAEPFPQGITRDEGVIAVRLREFASVPDIAGVAARLMTLVEEPASHRLFVSDMHGLLYTLGAGGGAAALYLDLRDTKWGVGVQSAGRERGLQAFALHPQFAQGGTPGYGKFYTYLDSTNQAPAPDFKTSQDETTHDTVLLEWTAKNPAAGVYDGEAPRELIRLRQPFANHNGGMIAFNPLAKPGTAEFGLLHMAIGDGGSGGDPMNMAQNLGAAFGKMFRIDPLGRNAKNGKYGIPASNPFVKRTGALPEIFLYGIRNSQGFSWDPKDGAMYLSDIGQNIVEEVNVVRPGANLGWNIWEGSYGFVSRLAVKTDKPRNDPKVTYPIVEWDQFDPIMLPNNSSASVGALVYRGTAIPQLNGRLLFADMPSGELFHVNADNLPKGGQDAIRRVLFSAEGAAAPRTFLSIVQDKTRASGKTVAARADLRFFRNAAGQLFLLNKADGTVRVIEP